MIDEGERAKAGGTAGSRRSAVDMETLARAECAREEADGGGGRRGTPDSHGGGITESVDGGDDDLPWLGLKAVSTRPLPRLALRTHPSHSRINCNNSPF
jgi:hypothetical protein